MKDLKSFLSCKLDLPYNKRVSWNSSTREQSAELSLSVCKSKTVSIIHFNTEGLRSFSVAYFTALKVVMLHAYFICNTTDVESHTSLCCQGRGFI